MSDLSCVWKVHTFPLMAVYQLPLSAYGFGDGIHHLSVLEQMGWRQPDWSVRLSRAAAPVLEGSPTNCIIFWDCCPLALFYIVGQEGTAFFYFFTYAFENITTLGKLNGNGKQPQSRCVAKSTWKSIFLSLLSLRSWLQICCLRLSFN